MVILLKNHNKLLISIIIFALLTTAFSDSYTTINIDNIATVVALGFDGDSDNNLKVSFQFAKPSSISESGPSGESSSIVKTVSASSIDSAINLMNNYMGKELTFSHCKLIVFSEEIANNNIENEIFTLVNDIQIRPSSNIIISKCSAEDYINNSKPALETLIAKYYEVFLSSSQFTGYTSNATIGDFFDRIICHSCNPYAILGGINLQLPGNSEDLTTNNETSSKSNSSTLSGDTTSENIGLAVFQKGTLVGELNAIETLSFMCLENEIKGFLISIPDDSNPTGYLDVYLTPTKDTKIDISLVNGSPYIKINSEYSGQIYSMSTSSNYLDSKKLDAVSKACNHYLETTFTDYLYKTAKELHSDVNSFGRKAQKLFLTTADFDNYDWNEEYKNSFFDVSVNTNVKIAGLLSDT